MATAVGETAMVVGERAAVVVGDQVGVCGSTQASQGWSEICTRLDDHFLSGADAVIWCDL